MRSIVKGYCPHRKELLFVDDASDEEKLEFARRDMEASGNGHTPALSEPARAAGDGSRKPRPGQYSINPDSPLGKSLDRVAGRLPDILPGKSRKAINSRIAWIAHTYAGQDVTLGSIREGFSRVGFDVTSNTGWRYMNALMHAGLAERLHQGTYRVFKKAAEVQDKAEGLASDEPRQKRAKNKRGLSSNAKNFAKRDEDYRNKALLIALVMCDLGLPCSNTRAGPSSDAMEEMVKHFDVKYWDAGEAARADVRSRKDKLFNVTERGAAGSLTKKGAGRLRSLVVEYGIGEMLEKFRKECQPA